MRHAELIILDHIQIDAHRGIHKLLAALRFPTIRTRQEIPDRPLVIDDLLNGPLITAPLQLISKLLRPLINQILRAEVLIEHLEIRRADTKHMTDEPRLPLRNAVYSRTAPIMAAENNAGDAELGTNALDSVGVRFEAEVAQIVGGAGVAVAHAIQRDTA